MKPTMRMYEGEADYWNARAFLRRVRSQDAQPGGTWHAAEFDYWRWHWLENVVERSPDELCLWADADDRIVALLVRGDPGVCHLQVDPGGSTAGLLDDMVAEAQTRHAVALDDGRRTVYVWSMEGDATLNGVLAQRGFTRFASEHSTEHNGRRILAEPIARLPVPDGFQIRSMGDVDEHGRRSVASWRAFHPGESEDECDRSGVWYQNVQRSPTYRRDLDVVAVAPNGDIASFVVCYFDDVLRSGVFVLDGTVPAYRSVGLAKAVMMEALRRLQWLGATAAYVSWYEAPAGALYRSVGFTDMALGRAWQKTR